MNDAIHHIIEHFKLLPHPEGGFYRRIYASKVVSTSQDEKSRATLSSIYFLMTGTNFSAFHRLDADELWHYYEGNTPLTIHVIHPDGRYEKITLDPKQRQFFAVVPAHCWFASECQNNAPTHYALVSCQVTPEFLFERFDLAQREELTNTFPQHKTLISKLTRA